MYESPLLFTRLGVCMESSNDSVGTSIKVCLNIKFLIVLLMSCEGFIDRGGKQRRLCNSIHGNPHQRMLHFQHTVATASVVPVMSGELDCVMLTSSVTISSH